MTREDRCVKGGEIRNTWKRRSARQKLAVLVLVLSGCRSESAAQTHGGMIARARRVPLVLRLAAFAGGERIDQRSIKRLIHEAVKGG
jgi:hypothetical protein